MKALLALARWIDALNELVGRVLLWLILVCVLISAGNAVSRYGFNISSNAMLDIQWYLFSAVFLGAAGYTLKHNQHVRIDLIFGRLSRRTQAWIDVFGTLFMMLPPCAIIFWFGWQAFVESYRVQEASLDAGGLPRWIVKALVPAGFGLLLAQGLSELIKRAAFLRGLLPEEAEHSSGIEEHLKIIAEGAPGSGREPGK